MGDPCLSSASTTDVVADLYQSHNDWLQAWLRRRLGNGVDAADLAHDAFLRLLLKPRCFDTAPEARAYLRTMANGLCVDLWRRRRIEQAWLDVLASRPEELAPSAEHQAVVVETLYEIDTLLRNLPPKAAQAFIMAVACEMTYKEVAEELGVSVRMVAKYVAKATLHCLRLDMRQALEELSHGGFSSSEAASLAVGS